MSDRLRWALVALVPSLFGLATIALQAASGTTLYDDEMGFLGEAVFFSTRSGTPALEGLPFYSTGYPLLLAAPLSVVPVDPWLVAVGTNVVLLGALGPLLYAMLRRALDAPRTTAMLAAIAGAVVPSVVLQTPRAWSEVALAVGVAGWAVLVLRWSHLGPATGAIPAAAASAALFAVHRRMLVVVLVTLTAIAVWSLVPAVAARTDARPRRLADRARAVPWTTLLGALAAAGAILALASVLESVVVDELYGGGTNSSRLDKLDNLQSTRWIPVLLGHVWSILATTFGLSGVALLVLGDFLRRGRHRVWAVVLLLVTGGLLMTSVVFFSTRAARADMLVYERYVAPITPVLVALAVAALAVHVRSARWGATVSALALAATAGVLSISLDESRLVGDFQKFTVPALTSLDVPSTGWGEAFTSRLHVLPITAIALVGLGAVVLASRRGLTGPLAATGMLGLVLAVGSAGNLRPFANVWEPTAREAAAFLSARDAPVLQYVPGTHNGARTSLQYRLGYPPARQVRPDACPDRPAFPYFVGPPDLESAHPVAPRIDVLNFPGVVYEFLC